MAVFNVERFSFDSGKNFTINIVTLSIICFKVSHVDVLNKFVLQSLNIAFIIANLDEMRQTTKLPFQEFPVYKGFIAQYQTCSIE